MVHGVKQPLLRLLRQVLSGVGRNAEPAVAARKTALDVYPGYADLSGRMPGASGRPFAQTAWGEIAPSSPWIGGKRTCSPLPRIWIRPQRAPRSPLCAFAFCRITHCGLPACGYTGKLCSSSTPLRVPPPVRRIATRSRSLPGMVQSIALQWHRRSPGPHSRSSAAVHKSLAPAYS